MIISLQPELPTITSYSAYTQTLPLPCKVERLFLKDAHSITDKIGCVTHLDKKCGCSKHVGSIYTVKIGFDFRNSRPCSSRREAHTEKGGYQSEHKISTRKICKSHKVPVNIICYNLNYEFTILNSIEVIFDLVTSH